MLGTGKTLEQAVAAFSKQMMASKDTRSQVNTAIASAGAATISDIVHVECSSCGTHTVTASATNSCSSCGTALASEDWSDITLTAENDGMDDIQVEVEEPMSEEIVEDLEVEESEDAEDNEDESDEDTEDESEEVEDAEEDIEDSEETIEEEIDDLTEESSDEMTEDDFADLSDEELDELDRELAAMEVEAQDTEDEVDTDYEELLEDESSDDSWVDIEASDMEDEEDEDEYSDESTDNWVDIESSDMEDEDDYSDESTDNWVDIEQSSSRKTNTKKVTKKTVAASKKVKAADYLEESEDSEEADEMSDQIEEIDLSENTEIEASDEVTCALVKAGNNVHWQLMCNQLPVARLTASTIRGSLKALASNGIDTPDFEKALVNTVNAAGKRALTVAKELGFVGIKVPAAIPRRLIASVQTDLTRAKSQILASHLDQQTKKHAQEFRRNMRVVATAINRGFYADVVNPLGSRLTKTLAGLGISNAAQTVKASLAESFEPFFDILMAKTIEFQQHPTQAKQAIASAIGQMAVLSEDDSEFEPSESEISEDYSAFMEVSSTTASSTDMSVEKLRTLFRLS